MTDLANVPAIEPLRTTLAEYGLQPASSVVRGPLTEFDLWVKAFADNGGAISVTVTPEGTATIGLMAEGPQGEQLVVAAYQGTQDECDQAIRVLTTKP